MSKAIDGLAMIGLAIGSLALMSTGIGFTIGIPLLMTLASSLAVGGVAMEAGAIADALTSNRGQNITTRQAASYRQVVYGEQRVGGVMVYESTTGSSHDQYNMIIVLAGHEIDSIVNLYLDGRQVFWQGSGDGYTVRNGVGFGGVADGNSHTGPNGVQYNFGGTGHSGLYCEARFGDQPEGDYIGALTANDPNWAPGTNGTPSLMGCAYIYLKLEYNTNVFPTLPPEIRITLRGKNNIYDPRTSTTGYTSNWALVVADVIANPDGFDQVGLNDNSVNQAQLIAAANVCDEQVALAAGGTESRYAAHYHCDTSTAPGSVLDTLMPAAAGRLSRIGGEWYIWPAYWQGPSFSFDESALTDSIQWTAKRKFRELFNRVNGTYIAPNFPFNIAGNYYDQNGFANGQQQDNFSYAFQPTNYPQYACDTLHGYASDQFLAQDGGRMLPKEMGQQCVLSVAQVQRVAKIMLLRNRQQGSGVFQMNLAAWQMQPVDVMSFTFASRGWNQKTLEITKVGFSVQGTNNEAPSVRATFNVSETDISVYEWSVAEELTVYDVPAAPTTQAPYSPAAPTDLALASLVQIQPDGTLVHAIQVSWNTPQDVRVTQIQVQYRVTGTSVWLDGGTVSVLSNATLVKNVISGQSYDVQICSVRANGATSPWVFASESAAVAFSPALYQGSGVDPQALAGQANAITIQPFQVTLGSARVSYYPNGTTISGLTLSTLYYVYTVDPTYAGGTPTPIATTNQADYLNQVGFILIGSVTTAA